MNPVSPATNSRLPKFGMSERRAAQALKFTDPDRWSRSTVDRYLVDLTEEMGSSARVASAEDARLLNAVPAVGPGLAACEDCRAVFQVQRRHPPTEYGPRPTRCAACVRERADRVVPQRRRAVQAWWRGTERGICIGCSHRGSGPSGTAMRTVPLGQLYCSDACRMIVKRYIERGGTITTPLAGAPSGVIRLHN